MILYEDKDIIVCHKPAGLPVQSARLGQKDMVSILNNHLAEKAWENSAGMTQKKQMETRQRKQEFVHVVHRLDQPVEGVIVFAKNPKAAANLTKQIQQNSIQKIYQAVCCVRDTAVLSGTTDTCCQIGQESASDKSTEIWKADENCGKLSKNQRDAWKNHLEDYLVKDGRTNTSRIAQKQEKDAKLAILDYEILDQKEVYVLIQVYLKTGRHHQIRVQMAHAGLPLYGDRKYHEQWQEYDISDVMDESEIRMRSNRQKESGRREKEELALCAVSYSFRHPSTGKMMKFEVKPENPAFQFFGNRS